MGSIKQTSMSSEKPSAPARGASLGDAKARIPKNVIFNFAGYAANILITFLIAPLLVHRLGDTAYGVWGLISEILGYSFLLDFGIRIAVTRYIGRHLALDEPEAMNRVLTTGLVFSAGSVVIVLTGGVVLAFLLPRLFSIPPRLVSDSRLTVVIVATALASSFPGSLFNGCVAALSRYDLLNIRNVAPNVIRALLLWFFLDRGYGLLAVALISSSTFVLAFILDFYFASRHLPGFAIERRFFDLSALRTLVDFSVYAFLLSVSWRLLFMTDNLVVGFVLGPAAVTFYTVGMNLADLLRGSLGNISNLFAPLAAQMHALEQQHSLQRLLFKGSRMTLLYALAGVGGLIVLGPQFLGFWMGQAFIGRTGPILIALVVEVACYALAYTCGQVLYGMNRHRFYAWLSMLQAATNFALSTILIRRFGPLGVALGTVIPALVVEALLLPVYTCRVLEVSIHRFYASSVARPLAILVPYVAWLWMLRAGGLVQGYFSLALAVASGLLVYALLGWWFVFDSEERERAWRSIGRLVGIITGGRQLGHYGERDG
jgi:O-antigen/teichoic acid export membrane protein